MIGIYKIISPTNRIYIGQSINIEVRFNGYKKYNTNAQPRLYASLKKYGIENHKFEIITECEIEQLNELERYYQDLYSVLDKNGLNCRLTGSKDRSGKHSEETKLKMSEAGKGRIHSEEHKRKNSESQKGNQRAKGYKHTEEALKKMSEANKGNKHNLGNKYRLGLQHSDTSKLKMSESQKGNINCLGRILSEETKLKISHSQKLRLSKKQIINS